MTLEEFSELFDVQYNNITSNQAPGLNEYEKSVFLTKAQDEIIKNYFTANSKGNNIQQGFDDSAKRQADFSVLMKTATCDSTTVGGNDSITIPKYTCTENGATEGVILYGSDITFLLDDEIVELDPLPNAEKYTVYNGLVEYNGTTYANSAIGFPYAQGTLTVGNETLSTGANRLDQRSKVYAFPKDVFIIINEVLADIPNKKYFQVIPLRYDEYTRLMSKPFKRPLKNQAWRLINSGKISDGEYIKCVEIITSPEYDTKPVTYTLRYLRRPKPIIVGNIDGLKINGCDYQDVAGTGCELDPILHEDILQRAVELAKVAWTQTGQDNTQAVIQVGQRSE